MRTNKAVINSTVNILSFIITFIPNILIRKVFLDKLGSEILGLSSLYTNIIGWLSIAELGIGTAIIFSLYKPYAANEKGKIRAYIKFYGSFYKKIGLLMLIAGILLSPFLRYFINENINLKLVTIGFILFLFNSFLSYIYSHKLCILNVAQEAYKITIGITISKLLIALLQYIMFVIYPSFILYCIIQLIINLIYYLIINLYVDKRYSWINSGEEELNNFDKKNLLKNVRAMFLHKIGTVIVFSTDNLVISKFIGLTSLSNYTNYNMIISAIQSVINTGLNGITASVGNLLTDNDIKKAYDIHKKVFFLNFWVISFVVISLYNTINQFIVLWVGKESLINKYIIVIILINIYFSSMRGSVEQFQAGSGNFYQDRYAPICEAIINLITSIILVNIIGLAGVFIGTLISNFTVVFWTKPYVVYKYVFKKSVIEYFKMYFKYALIAIIPLVITSIITAKLKVNYDFISFMINCFINVIVINLTYLLIFFKTDEFNYYRSLILKLILKR